MITQRSIRSPGLEVTYGGRGLRFALADLITAQDHRIKITHYR
jgi:hypothetical protein